MKIKNLFKYMAVAAVTLSMGSCGEDFLDRTPLNQYTAPTFYSSDAAVRKATEPCSVWDRNVPTTRGTRM